MIMIKFKHNLALAMSATYFGRESLSSWGRSHSFFNPLSIRVQRKVWQLLSALYVLIMTLYMEHHEMASQHNLGNILPAWNDISHISPTHMVTDHFYGVYDRSLGNLVESDHLPCQTLARCVWEVLYSDNPSWALGIMWHSGGSTAVWQQLRAGRERWCSQTHTTEPDQHFTISGRLKTFIY